ncbi:hypothetical protein [Methylobacterium sp. A54F]
MTLTVLDPRTGTVVTIEVPVRRPVRQPVPAVVVPHPHAARAAQAALAMGGRS